MPQEIERKFLVATDAWRIASGPGKRLAQVYLAETEHAAIRVRIEDDASATLTIKSANPGLSRAEFEYPVPLSHARALADLRQGSALEKQRFKAEYAGRTWEIDVYSGENEGLVLAEVELASETAPVDLPDWVGREVTGEARYYASRLAKRPFGSWTDRETWETR